MNSNLRSSSDGSSSTNFSGMRSKPSITPSTPGGARRIAVRVLAAACGDLHRLLEVSAAEQQAEGDVGAVELGVDVEVGLKTVGTRIVHVPLVFDQLPHLAPVVGMLSRPVEQILDQLPVLTVGRNARQAGRRPPRADRPGSRPRRTCRRRTCRRRARRRNSSHGRRDHSTCSTRAAIRGTSGR